MAIEPPFDAVLADLKETAPDLIVHGGDLAPNYIAGSLRDFGWQSVVGNADEMLFRSASLGSFEVNVPPLKRYLTPVRAAYY